MLFLLPPSLPSSLLSPALPSLLQISLLDLSSLPHQFATGPRPTHHQVIYPRWTPLLLPLSHHHHQSSLLVPAGKGLFVGSCLLSLLFVKKKGLRILDVVMEIFFFWACCYLIKISSQVQRAALTGVSLHYSCWFLRRDWSLFIPRIEFVFISVYQLQWSSRVMRAWALSGTRNFFHTGCILMNVILPASVTVFCLDISNDSIMFFITFSQRQSN